MARLFTYLVLSLILLSFFSIIIIRIINCYHNYYCLFSLSRVVSYVDAKNNFGMSRKLKFVRQQYVLVNQLCVHVRHQCLKFKVD